jgi:hypothetical protein
VRFDFSMLGKQRTTKRCGAGPWAVLGRAQTILYFPEYSVSSSVSALVLFQISKRDRGEWRDGGDDVGERRDRLSRLRHGGAKRVHLSAHNYHVRKFILYFSSCNLQLYG